jgi:ABC-2 type transport system permease protein
MGAFTALVKKDLIQYFSNRRSVLVSIVAPILIGAFFGYVFGGNGNSDPGAIAINVVDLDQSQVSQDIVSQLKAEKQFAVSTEEPSRAEAALKAGKFTANLVIPKGFGEQAGRALFAGPPRPSIEVHYDPSQKLTLQVIKGLLAQDVMQSVTKVMFSNPAAAFPDLRQRLNDENNGMDPERKRDLTAMLASIEQVQNDNLKAANTKSAASSVPSLASQGLSLPYTTNDTETSSGSEAKYNGYAHSFAGMGVQFILFMGIDIGIALLTMRRMDLWKRLKAAPLSKATLLASRLASCAIIALVIFSIILTVAMLVFGVRIEGSPVGLVAILIAFALMTASFGLMIAALGRSPEVTRGLAIVATLVLVMLGGAWVPAFVFPKWLQTVSLAVPTRWAVDGLDAMLWRGLGFDAVLAPVVVLLGFTLVFGAIALVRFDWDE